MYTSTTHRKPRFSLVKGEHGWYWSAILPSQTHRVPTRKEALTNLATLIQDIRDGRLSIVEVDATGPINPQPILGGLKHVLSYLEKKGAKNGKSRRSV